MASSTQWDRATLRENIPLCNRVVLFYVWYCYWCKAWNDTFRAHPSRPFAKMPSIVPPVCNLGPHTNGEKKRYYRAIDPHEFTVNTYSLGLGFLDGLPSFQGSHTTEERSPSEMSTQHGATVRKPKMRLVNTPSLDYLLLLTLEV